MASERSVAGSTTEIAGIETYVRRTEGEGVPTLLVHGNPTHSADWSPFLDALPGPGIALDLPSFGRSQRPHPSRFDASMHSYAEFLGAAIDQLAPERYNLVVHDWGAIALHPAQRRSERLRRLVVINAVPLLAGYRWHWLGRLWRTPLLGELFVAGASRRGVDVLLRQARPGHEPMPEEFIEMIWSCWDRDTGRAVLRLYRSADPPLLEAAGARLAELRCPSLVVWGQEDPYIGPAMGRGYAARLGSAELVEVAGAGHWPWLDRPELVPRVAAFLR